MPIYEYYITKRTPLIVKAESFEEADRKAQILDGNMREDRATLQYHLGSFNDGTKQTDEDFLRNKLKIDI